MELLKKLWALITYPFQPSGLTASPHGQATTVARNPLVKLNMGLILMLIVWIALVIVRWWANIEDSLWIVAIIGGISFWVTLIAGLRTTNVVASGFIGGFAALLFDQDKSQGIAKGPIWLFKLVRNVAFLDLLITFTLMTWSFGDLPGAFWVLFAGVIIIQIASAVWKLETGKIAPTIIIGYAVICILIGLVGTLDRNIGKQAFDTETGAALIMYDETTGQEDPLGRTPAECAVKGCFVAATGVKLVPMPSEVAAQRNVVVAANSIWSWASSPYFWAVVAGIVILVPLAIFVPGVRGAIVPVAILIGIGGAIWYMVTQEGTPSSKPSVVATSTTDCGGKITPKVMETFILKKGCSYIFDLRLMPDGFDIAPTQAGIDGKLFWTENPTHHTTAGRKEARIDTVEDAFVGRNELRMFFAPFGSSDGKIKLMRDRLTERSAAELAAATAKLLAEAK